MDSEFNEELIDEDLNDGGQDYIVEEYDDPDSSARGCFLIILMILMTLLFFFFCPVDKVEKKRARAAAPKENKGPGEVGDTKYAVTGGKIVYTIGGKATYSKAKLIVLSFTVKNLSNSTKIFDDFMVSLSDDSNRIYPVHDDYSMLRYELKGDNIPLPLPVGAHDEKEVTLVFSVERAGTSFWLIGHDFNMTTTKSVQVAVPKMFDPQTPFEIPNRTGYETPPD